jgi:hypothetical protein
MVQQPLESTRTKAKACVYEAECQFHGRSYSARSRRGAPNALARVLVAAGAPDQTVEIYQVRMKGSITYTSLHEMARWAYQESATVSLRRVRWNPTDFGAAFRKRDGQNRDDSPTAVVEQPGPLLGRF